MKLPAEPGDTLTCWWDVTLQYRGKEKVETLRSGEFTFSITARPEDFPVDLGIARKLGKYHLAEGIKLQLSRGRETTGTIEWADGRRYKIQLTQRKAKDPIGLITWWRGGTAFWIAGDEELRKIDFADSGDVKDQSWKWDDAPSDFGGAPEKVQAEIEKHHEAQNSATTEHSGILIMPVDTDTRQPIEKFRVLAGVPSSVSNEFEKRHNVSVINWQPHTIRQAEDGNFVWPTRQRLRGDVIEN